MTRRERKQLFCQVFSSSAGAIVLAELEKFAKANEANFVPDPRLETYLSGRRSVICEIKQTMEENIDEQP